MGGEAGSRFGLGVVVVLVAAMSLAPVAIAQKKGPGKKGPGGISEASESVQAAGNGALLSATATCPGKRKAIAGGFTLSTPSLSALSHPFESIRVGSKSWQVSAQIQDADAPTTQSLTTYAYCQRRAPKIRPVSVPTSITPSTSIAQRTTAVCPGSRVLGSVGFQVPAPILDPASPGAFATLIDSFPLNAQSSQASAVAALGGTVTAHGYCLRSKKEPTIVSTPSPGAGGGQVTSAVASCPSKRKAVGGGFSQPSFNVGAFRVFESRRVGSSWQVSGFAIGDAPARAILGHAVCGR